MVSTAGNQFRRTAIACSCCYALACIFLILVLIGNISNIRGSRDLFFYKLELANIIPVSSPNAQLLNSVARSLGLHDFYQVGLWNFCEGYNDEGITHCSNRKSFYWFNPISVIMSELLSGAQIALPMQLVNALTLLRIASQVMFALFLIGIIINFFLIFLSLLPLRTRTWSIPLIAVSLLATLMITIATIVGTIMSITAKYAVHLQSELNIKGDISVGMLVAMWIATVATAIAFFMHCALGCCLRPRKALMTDVVGAQFGSRERVGMMEDETARRESMGVFCSSGSGVAVSEKRASGLISRFRASRVNMERQISGKGSSDGNTKVVGGGGGGSGQNLHVPAAPLR